MNTTRQTISVHALLHIQDGECDRCEYPLEWLDADETDLAAFFAVADEELSLICPDCLAELLSTAVIQGIEEIEKWLR